MNLKLSTTLAAAALVLALPAGASAHTESDVVAVPAGSEATVTLKPTHGCGDSPTTEVAIQAPVAGATAGEVEGWSATAADDGEGHTVLEWTGGALPSAETGAFPVTFTAPDTPGELLTFPSIQTCENGEELSWISGDPADDYPAPRLLILPAGSEAATTVDDVPADAPGRAQLTEVVDVDNPAAPTTTAPAEDPATTTEAAASPTTQAEGSTTTTTEAADEAEDDDDDGDANTSSAAPIIAIAALVIAAAGGGYALWRRRQAT